MSIKKNYNKVCFSTVQPVISFFKTKTKWTWHEAWCKKLLLTLLSSFLFLYVGSTSLFSRNVCRLEKSKKVKLFNRKTIIAAEIPFNSRFKMGRSWTSFYSFSVDCKQMFHKIFRWLDLNWEPLVLEATALPTVSHPLLFNCLLYSSK